MTRKHVVRAYFVRAGQREKSKGIFFFSSSLYFQDLTLTLTLNLNIDVCMGTQYVLALNRTGWWYVSRVSTRP